LQAAVADDLRTDSGELQRAVDFIEVDLDGPIVLADIVAAFGIPGRTLAQHFHRFRGTTPMRYLRRARLAKVHETLQRAEPEESVASIALSSGFAYMARFAGRIPQNLWRDAVADTSEALAGLRSRPP
jgi:transcriptional regulator GlxA family with amidase domain